MPSSDGNTASEWVPTGSVTVRVPGKVNLFLGVGDLRDDGYHELTTVFHAVSLFDEITVRNADLLSLELSGEGVGHRCPTITAIWRGARRSCWPSTSVAGPTSRSRSRSRSPWQAGWRGAAPTPRRSWWPINALWELGVPRRDLHALAAELGSDVPFALHGGTALGTGRGEQLATVLARNTFHWVLAFAEGGLSTPKVFAEIDRLRADSGRGQPPSRLEEPEPLLAALASGDAAQLAPLLGNDLQPAALSLDPGLRRTLRAGQDAGALAGIVSGSGPTCAFLCSSASSAIDVGVRVGRRGRLPHGAGGQRPGARRTHRANAVGAHLKCDPRLNSRIGLVVT